MFKTKKDIIVKLHLVISVIIVIPTALIYGFSPSSQFDIDLQTVDEESQFKAIMGLYLGFSLLWILGLFKTNYLKTALVSNFIFMLSMGFGRLISWFTDGTPTFAYQFGTFAELFLGCYGLWVLTQYQSSTNT